MQATVAQLRELIRDVPEFPSPGVTFKDLTPLFGDPAGLASCVEFLAAPFDSAGVDKVIGVEARGFILAAPVAVSLGAGFVPVRKAGKLPWHVHSETYELEYGSDTLEIHRDAISPSDRILIVDDVLATGGTAAATSRLVRRLAASTVGFACVVELAFLRGRDRLDGIDVHSLVSYE
jgi:adenine phosphoribosyltransferase